jgi:hypothetical protein
MLGIPMIQVSVSNNCIPKYAEPCASRNGPVYDGA